MLQVLTLEFELPEWKKIHMRRNLCGSVCYAIGPFQ